MAAPSSTSSSPTASGVPAPSLSPYEIDERLTARAAVAAADEKWRSLCTSSAASFVAAERRSAAVREALAELLDEVGRAGPSVGRVDRALDPERGYGGDDDDGEREGVDWEEEKDDDGRRRSRSAAAALADLAEKHRLRRRTLLQHSSLLELLELPSLMDACVRSALYDDALSIAGFANALERRHLTDGRTGSGAAAQQANQQKQQQSTFKSVASSAKAPAQRTSPHHRGDVVAGVVAEIRRREADLRRMLLHRLRGDVTMPQCLEVVTALRRLNGVELERRGTSAMGGGGRGDGGEHDLEGVHAAMEMRLQVDFFEARDAWLEAGVARVGSAAAAVASSSSVSGAGGDKGKLGKMGTGAAASGSSAQAEQILDGIERYRTRCFEIVTQFLAIFRGSFAPSPSTGNAKNDHSHALLSMWTARKIQTFLSGLRANVEAHVHDTAALRDALDAAAFFAVSMGRVGADFRPLLGAGVFEPRLVRLVAGHWTDGLSCMVETLKACRDAGVAGPLFAEASLSSFADNDGGAADLHSSRTLFPPRKLLSLPPLARFVNAHLAGLNELRRCLLPVAFPAIRAAQAKLISDARAALQANERAALTPGLRGEASKLREVAARLKAEFDRCVAPYMEQCLEVALGNLDHALAEAEERASVAEARERAERERAAAEEGERARIAAEEKATEEETERAETARHEKEALEAADATEKGGNGAPSGGAAVEDGNDSNTVSDFFDGDIKQKD